MPRIFGDGMVLQREAPIAIWGHASPGERVEVRLDAAFVTTAADAHGDWMVHLPPFPAGGPYCLEVSGDTSLVFQDVLVGEVWLGVGQSNMGLPVQDCDPTTDELAPSPRLRLFQQRALPLPEPDWDGDGFWSEARGEAITVFSGALYFHGLELHRQLDVPVGLIQASVGGTIIEAWIDRDEQYATHGLAGRVLACERRYDAFDIEKERAIYRRARSAWREAAARQGISGEHHPGRPRDQVEIHIRTGNVGQLFNSRIAPIIPYTLRGAVWYQGESNVRTSDLYETQLNLLIASWRERWGQGDFPFGWVQLANFAAPRQEDWPGIREAMRRCLWIPNTGMAVAADVGMADNIHPRNKRDVGQRLAKWALGSVYGRDVCISGPMFRSMRSEAHRAVLSFEHTDGGLARRGDALVGFEALTTDGTWRPAEAWIVGDTVHLEVGSGQRILQVRYAWSADPTLSLYNGEGLPASPFTTE